MKNFLLWLRKDSTKNVMMTIDVVIMLVLLWFYLMHADLSTAPEFIYNQF